MATTTAGQVWLTDQFDLTGRRRRREEAGCVIPGILLRGVRGVSDDCRQHQPLLRPDRLLRPLHDLPPRLLGALRDRRNHLTRQSLLYLHLRVRYPCLDSFSLDLIDVPFDRCSDQQLPLDGGPRVVQDDTVLWDSGSASATSSASLSSRQGPPRRLDGPNILLDHHYLPHVHLAQQCISSCGENLSTHVFFADNVHRIYCTTEQSHLIF